MQILSCLIFAPWKNYKCIQDKARSTWISSNVLGREQWRLMALSYLIPRTHPREPSGWQVWGVGSLPYSLWNVFTWKQNSEYAGFSSPHVKKRHLLPSGSRANTIPLPPRAVTRNPAFITDRTARPLALAITWAAKVRDNRWAGASRFHAHRCAGPIPGFSRGTLRAHWSYR